MTYGKTLFFLQVFLYVLPLLDVCIFLFFLFFSLSKKKQELENTVYTSYSIWFIFPTLLLPEKFPTFSIRDKPESSDRPSN